MRKTILILHGNRQTGELLLGRLDKLRKATSLELGWDMVAPDAPHLYSLDDDDIKDNNINDNHDQWQRTWWHRKDNVYDGIEESISMLLDFWDKGNYIGILGFSQGSQMAHITTILNHVTNGAAFHGLKFVVHVSGYGDCPLPDNLFLFLRDSWGIGVSNTLLEKISITIPSLHIMGKQDKLIPSTSSMALMKFYENPMKYNHPGGHHVPIKAGDIQDGYLQFFKDLNQQIKSQHEVIKNIEPDSEHMQTQIDEVLALSQIFPTEFRLLSKSTILDNADPSDYSEENRAYEHPIRFSIILQSQEDSEQNQELWPPKQISLAIEYPLDYPDSSPIINILHDMNYLEFSIQQSNALMNAIRSAMVKEIGMPCVIGMIYTARDFFESGGLASATTSTRKKSDTATNANTSANEIKDDKEEKITSMYSFCTTLLKPSSTERNSECNEEGLDIAYRMLRSSHTDDEGVDNGTNKNITSVGKGGSWKYTVGLVGKPSAGKSTFFNAATAFARQRGVAGGTAKHNGENGDDGFLAGAAMAPHPFTTIDPNIGFCLVPAPPGSCPEDDESCRCVLVTRNLSLGSTHGRDSEGRRMISICLKDVAGLVPGAYRGRGKGNKFLDDLTDADVLVHVVDASGLSDAEGNKVTNDEVNNETNHPIADLAWVRNELVEWVFFNVASKWDNVVRRGRDKLVGMFSGYKQSQSFVLDIFLAVEAYVKEKEGRDRIFDHLQLWDEGDLYRLVSAFLGVRFPMALALNKCDLPTSEEFIDEIKAKLPIHGAHDGIGLSAHKEMQFMRDCISLAKKGGISASIKHEIVSSNIPNGVWGCLQSVMAIRSPILVFPVNDMSTYEPLPGMTKYATRDPSLPHEGMVSYLTRSGGCAPSNWHVDKNIYTPIVTKNESKPALRDVLLMKPGSTIEDVFLGLKWIGALDGEFVRAEAAFYIGDKPKLVSKSDAIGKHNRILRIMTTKRKV